MNLTGEPISADEADAARAGQPRGRPTTSSSTPRWRGPASSPGRRRWPSGRSRRCPPRRDLDEGIEAEKQGFAAVFASEDAREGIGAFLGKRDAAVERALTRARTVAAPWPSSSARPARWSRSPARGSRCRPGSPTSARPAPGCGRTSIPPRSRTSAPFGATPRASGTSTATASPRWRESSPTAPTGRWRRWRSDGLLDAVITQNIDRLHRRGGVAPGHRGARDDRALVLPDMRRAVPARRRARPARRGPPRASRAATAARR